MGAGCELTSTWPEAPALLPTAPPMLPAAPQPFLHASPPAYASLPVCPCAPAAAGAPVDVGGEWGMPRADGGVRQLPWTGGQRALRSSPNGNHPAPQPRRQVEEAAAWGRAQEHRTGCCGRGRPESPTPPRTGQQGQAAARGSANRLARLGCQAPPSHPDRSTPHTHFGRAGPPGSCLWYAVDGLKHEACWKGSCCCSWQAGCGGRCAVGAGSGAAPAGCKLGAAPPAAPATPAESAGCRPRAGSCAGGSGAGAGGDNSGGGNGGSGSCGVL
eukprot:1138539-Pelagomonas_calceolata.AAC.3